MRENEEKWVKNKGKIREKGEIRENKEKREKIRENNG